MALPKVGKGSLGKFKVKGGNFSMKELKERFSKSGSGLFIFIKDGESARVRFMAPPEEWRLFSEHRVQKGDRYMTVPCVGDVCPLDEGDQPSEKVLVPVYDVKTKKARVIKMGSKVANVAMGLHAREKLMDRDYNYIREGGGLDTTYILDPEDKEKRPELKKVKALDLDKILEQEVDRYYGGKGKKGSDDDDDDEEEETKRKKKSSKDDDEDEEEDEEDEEEDDDEDEDEEEEEEDEPKKKGKAKGKKSKADADDDEDSESDDDDDEDEDEEDEDEDEEDDESDDEDDEEDEDEEEEDEEDEEDDEDDDKPAKPDKLKSKKKGKKGKK